MGKNGTGGQGVGTGNQAGGLRAAQVVGCYSWIIVRPLNGSPGGSTQDRGTLNLWHHDKEEEEGKNNSHGHYTIKVEARKVPMEPVVPPLCLSKSQKVVPLCYSLKASRCSTQECIS